MVATAVVATAVVATAVVATAVVSLRCGSEGCGIATFHRRNVPLSGSVGLRGVGETGKSSHSKINHNTTMNSSFKNFSPFFGFNNVRTISTPSGAAEEAVNLIAVCFKTNMKHHSELHAVS